MLKTNIEPQQPVIYLLSAILKIVNEPELAYHIMLRIWNDLLLKRHYEESDGSYDFCHSMIKTLGNYVTLLRPKIADRLN